MAEKPTLHIASCSFGKDSIATILLALKHNEPLDRVVFAEVMYDYARNMSGEVPEHIEWIYGTAIPKLQEMGVRVDVVRDKTDYLQHFHHILTKGERKGKVQGYPIAGRCCINNRCKIRPIREYYKQFGDCNIVQYIGIAVDEPLRLERLKKSTGNRQKVSLMVKYDVTEAQAMQMCRDAGLLSPLYDTGSRGGCWFCPNMRVDDMRRFRKTHADMWNELVSLEQTPNLVGCQFKYTQRISDIDRRFAFEDRQMNLF